MIKEYKNIRPGWYGGVKEAPLSKIIDSYLKNYGNGDKKRGDGEGLDLVCDIVRYTDAHTIMNAVIAVRSMVEIFNPYAPFDGRRKSKPVEKFVLNSEQETYAFEEGQRFIRFKDSRYAEGICNLDGCLSELSDIADKLDKNPEKCKPGGRFCLLMRILLGLMREMSQELLVLLNVLILLSEVLQIVLCIIVKRWLARLLSI